MKIDELKEKLSPHAGHFYQANGEIRHIDLQDANGVGACPLIVALVYHAEDSTSPNRPTRHSTMKRRIVV